MADGGLDQLVHVSWPDGRHASLRRLVFDLIEEYGRHTGHADLLREAVDGLVGEDPPAGWQASASDESGVADCRNAVICGSPALDPARRYVDNMTNPFPASR